MRSPHRIVFGMALLAFALSPCSFAFQTASPPSEVFDQLKKESDPVRRAKTLTKLAGPQLDSMTRLADGGDFIHSGELLEQYRDEVKLTFDGLKESGIDAERKPSGFKELQIHLRRSLQQIDDVIRIVPEGPRVPFQSARAEIAQINRSLIEMLFPLHAGKKKGKLE